MATPTFTSAGAKAATAKTLPKEVFGLEVTNHELLKQAYVTYLANGRQNLAVTKKRGEVSGGGKKPWRQKGTGRARFGSSRNPIWRGGGIAFGPTGQENYSKQLSTTSKRQAIRQALTLKHNAGSIIIIDNFVSKEGKTKATVDLLKKIGASGRILIATSTLEPITARALKNIPRTELVRADRLNVYDVLNADTIVLTSDAVTTINQWLGSAAKKVEEK